jgi:hypothetical protein
MAHSIFKIQQPSSWSGHLRILWCPKVHHRVHNSPTLVLILSHITPITHPIYVFCKQARRNVCELNSWKHSPEINIRINFPHGTTAPPPQWAKVSSLSRHHDHTMTHHSRYESSGRVISLTQRPLPDNTHNRQASMPSAGFEPAVPASERPETHVSYRADSGVGRWFISKFLLLWFVQRSGDETRTHIQTRPLTST